MTIDQSGSYRLTSHLSAGRNTGIEITSDLVNLDLNGFSVRGSVIVIGPPSGNPGITALDQLRTSVSNGEVTRFTGGGIRLGDDCRVHGVRATDNGGTGIMVGSGCSVSDNTASGNSLNGISASDGNLVTGNVSVDNRRDGISARSGNNKRSTEATPWSATA